MNNRLDRIKSIIHIDKIEDYAKLAKESAASVEEILNCNLTEDELYLAIWNHFVSINICDENELDEVRVPNKTA